MSDKEILRELAKRYMEAAGDPVNGERKQRGYDTNGLKSVRPLVWLDEVPWHEMNVDDELTLTCEGEEARAMEQFFRRRLYQWRHFQADMVLEPSYIVYKNYRSSGIGLQISESILRIDGLNHIVSHKYDDQLDTMEKVERLHPGTITRDQAAEEAQLAFACDMLDGIMPVTLRGCPFYYMVWDDISMLRGMAPLLMDLLLEPELMHATIRKFAEIRTAEVDQMEKLDLFSSDLTSIHCTPPYSRELEENQMREGGGPRCTWFRAAAQPLGQVSPALHDEFDIEYLLPLASRFGLTYYGCCESLFDRLDIIKKIPNLRKVGVTPWSKVEVSAEQLGGNFVFARKPNPAMVMRHLDEDAIRKETRETVEMCLKYHCPYELVLKDISTVSYHPENLTRWVDIVESTIDEYY